MDILGRIGWRDILDILLLWFVCYKLLLIIKGIRAVYLFIVISLLLIGSLVSSKIGLHTFNWLVTIIWSNMGVALIVLFHPEIRRALVHAGSFPFTSAGKLKSIDEIVKAVISLSARRIGAILIIEKDTTLMDFVEIGIMLDARLSREIILSIFHPTSPIHDGAIIIKGNTILAAGCFLPISLRHDIDKVPGTRHRAALSITEETDSTAIIVSEETGSISVASLGMFEADIDTEKLRNILRNIT